MSTSPKSPKASAASRLKDIKGDKSASDERKLLEQYLALTEKEAALGAKVKAAEGERIAKVAVKYGKLSEDEIKTLVVEDKWLGVLEATVQGELDRVSQTLTGRVRELAERYAMPLPKVVDEVAMLAARVEEHLKKMGATWN